VTEVSSETVLARHGRREGPPRAALHLVAAIFCLCATSCYSFIGRYSLSTKGQTPYVEGKRRYWYVEVTKRNVHPREMYTTELLSCQPVQPVVVAKGALRPAQRPGQPRPVTERDATDGVLVFRAGLIADIHIRQPSVKLYSDSVSRDLRYVIESFERNGYQEAFGSAGFLAMVSAFNQLDSAGDKPRLVMNAGDAIDAGTIEEAYDFASAMHYLRYPWLYALGNHDAAIFGNYKSKLAYTKDAGPAFYPIGQHTKFLRYFGNRRRISGLADELIPIPDDYQFAALHARWAALDVPRESEAKIEDPAPQKTNNTCGIGSVPASGEAPAPTCKQLTFCSGFDLYGRRSDGSNCDSYPGYYAVVVPGSDGSKVQLIVLKTTHNDNDWGAEAEFDQVQRDWLAQQLKESASATIVLVHHRPGEVPGLVPMLDPVARARPVLILSGHTHGHLTRWLGKLWELNTGSLGEFPHWGRIVEIRRASSGRYYVNARTIRPQLSMLATPPDLTAYGVPRGLSPDDWDSLPAEVLSRLEPWFGSQFAACDVVAAHPTDPLLCDGGKGTLLHDSAQCAYLGSLYDHLYVPDAFLGKGSSQSGADARREANVIVDISP
jgi:hypothetical protein